MRRITLSMTRTTREAVGCLVALILVFLAGSQIQAATAGTPIGVCTAPALSPGASYGACTTRAWKVPAAADLVRTQGANGLGGAQMYEPYSALSGQSLVTRQSDGTWVTLASTGNLPVTSPVIPPPVVTPPVVPPPPVVTPPPVATSATVYTVRAVAEAGSLVYPVAQFTGLPANVQQCFNVTNGTQNATACLPPSP